MLKFAVDPSDPKKPAIVGLGLSHLNLSRLPIDAIQFYGTEVGLGEGVFAIAHGADPQLPLYQSLLGSAACELVTLSDGDLAKLRAGQLLHVPLRSTRAGRPCEALIFAGETEEILLAAMQKQGLFAPDAEIKRGPPRAFRVDFLHRAKLAVGGVGFIIAAVLVATKGRFDGMMAFVTGLMAVTSLVFWTMLYSRWNERVELDGEGLRRVHPLFPFHLPWGQLGEVLARSDVDGPFELEVYRRSGGRPHKLGRIYEDWDALVHEISIRTRI